jgi:hypothetical protein
MLESSALMASRNRMQANSSLFEKAASLLAKFGEEYSFENEGRFIDLNEDMRERAVIAKADVLAKFESESIRAVLIREAGDKGQFNFLISGRRLSLENVNYRLATPGENLLFYNIFDLKLASSPKEFYNIASFYVADDYSGHDSNRFFSCLETVYTIPYDEESVCVTKFLTDFLLAASQVDVFYGDDYSSAIKLGDYISCDYEILKLKSILRFGTKRQFLELYNGIENLYFRVYCNDLYKNCKTQLPEDDFYASIENFIGWRPKETDAFVKVIKILLSENSSVVETVARHLLLDIPVEGATEKLAEKISDKIYSFRNDCIHWRTGKNAAPSLEKINQYSIACLEVIGAFPRSYFRLNDVCACGDATISLV